MSSEPRPKEEWDVLSAKAFGKALQGETVQNIEGDDVHFLNEEKNTIVVKEVIVTDIIELTVDKTYSDSIRIMGGEFQQHFRIIGKTFKVINISNKNGFFNELIFRTRIKCEIRIEETYINRLFFAKELHKDGNIYLNDCHLNQLEFRGFTNENQISIKKITVMESVYEGRKKNKDGWLTKDQVSSLLLTNSDLGNISFFDTQFDNFKKIIVKSCRFTGLKTTEGHFPLANVKNPIFQRLKDFLFRRKFNSSLQVVTDNKNNQDPQAWKRPIINYTLP